MLRIRHSIACLLACSTWLNAADVNAADLEEEALPAAESNEEKTFRSVEKKAGYTWLEPLSLGTGYSPDVEPTIVKYGGYFHFPMDDKQLTVNLDAWFHGFFDEYVERANGEEISGLVLSAGLSRTWHKPHPRGYRSVSVGLSVLSGELGEDCTQTSPNLIFGDDFACDSVNDFTTLGIPVRLSMGLGYRIGVALNLDLNINTEQPYLGFSVSFPIIGSFMQRN